MKSIDIDKDFTTYEYIHVTHLNAKQVLSIIKVICDFNFFFILYAFNFIHKYESLL